MKFKPPFAPLLSLLLLCMPLIAGCAGSLPLSYYQLVAPAKGTTNEAAQTFDAVLGIGPVHLPQYLDQPKLVNRLSANRLQLSDRNRWIEPLGANIASVLEESLRSLLHPKQIVLFPWPLSQPIDLQLSVEVLRFETENGTMARLLVNWTVKNRQGELVLPERQGSYQVEVSTPDPAGRVHALNEALELFCQDLAVELRPLLRKKAGISS